jgi:hypothetical protein
MKRQLAKGGIALLSVAALVGVTATANAATAAKVSVSIQTEADGFSGFVSSSKSSCGTKKTKSGTDTAQPNGDRGQWKISVSKSGKYYAQTSSKSGCAAGKSKTISAKLSQQG